MEKAKKMFQSFYFLQPLSSKCGKGAFRLLWTFLKVSQKAMPEKIHVCKISYMCGYNILQSCINYIFTYIFDLFRHSYCDLHCQTRHITYSRFHLQRSSAIISISHYLSSCKLVTISHAPSLLIFHFNNHFPSNSNCFTTALDC